VYAYDVVVVGSDRGTKLFKCVYAAGANLGVGHEPHGGVTSLYVPKTQLPKGARLTIAVRPITSLGTAGHAIACVYDRAAKVASAD